MLQAAHGCAVWFLAHMTVGAERMFRDRQRNTREYSNNSIGDAMRLAAPAKLPLLALGFVVVTAGILWVVNLKAPRKLAQEVAARETANPVQTPSEPGESLWSQLLPKSTIQKRDEVRAQRQLELSSMIEKLHGVSTASVVLSDAARQAIGQPHRPMTACVTVEPSGTMSRASVQAICALIAGATLGLDAENVTIINSLSGVICTSDTLTQNQPFNVAAARKQVEDALGLVRATVSVKMEQLTHDGAVFVPWRDQLQPFVRITLPRSWVLHRSEQLGEQSIVIEEIRTIVNEVVPGARFEAVVIQDTPAVLTTRPTSESYAKQIAVVVGLLTVLLSGFIADRHRRPKETVVMMQVVPVRQEAIGILAMEHQVAKQAIDTLTGSRRVDVLRAIIAMGDEIEVPVVQVPVQKQLELTRCG